MKNLLQSLYKEHLQTVQNQIFTALEELGFESLVLGSGELLYYFEDDQSVPFRSNGFFSWVCPLSGPHHFLQFLLKQRKPLLIQHQPQDFWYDSERPGPSYWNDFFEIQSAPSPEAAWKRLNITTQTCFLGSETLYASASNLNLNPESLKARLQWARSYKTDYEIHCISKANKLGVQAHRVAKAAFEAGKSEYEIYRAYCDSLQILDNDFSYPCIVALDAKSATLHYEGKRKNVKNAKVALIDAGAPFEKYHSDITRTHVLPSAHPVFIELRNRLDEIQQKLCAQVRPGLPMPDLMRSTHLQLGKLLKTVGILKTEHLDSLVEQGILGTFMPHGLGHLLGIFIHDVAGKAQSKNGDLVILDSHAKYAHFGRTTRTLEEKHVLTIEPGIYFVPLLLESLKQRPEKNLFHWKLIEELIPCGGIRIEDNVVVTTSGHRNLTREFIEYI